MKPTSSTDLFNRSFVTAGRCKVKMDVATPWLPGRKDGDFLCKKVHGWKKACENEVEDYVRWLVTRCLKQICSLTWGFVDPIWYFFGFEWSFSTACHFIGFWLIGIGHYDLTELNLKLLSATEVVYVHLWQTILCNNHFAVSNIRFSSDMSWHLPAQRWMQIGISRGLYYQVILRFGINDFFCIPDPQQKSNPGFSWSKYLLGFEQFLCSFGRAWQKPPASLIISKLKLQGLKFLCVWSRFLINSNMWWIYSKK